MSSRVAKKPVVIPAGVDVTIDAEIVTVKSSKGSLQHKIPAKVKVIKTERGIEFEPRDSESDAIAGTMRSIVNNMVQGVKDEYKVKLVLVGVGYRAQAQGKELGLTLGHSHPVKYKVPAGITIETPSQTEIIVKGVDKQLVGQVSADIIKYRPPEPYKGKGVRFHDQVIILKEAKKK